MFESGLAESNEVGEVGEDIPEAMDSIKFVTRYLNRTNAPIYTNKKEREEKIQEWLVLYKDETLDIEERLMYRDYVIFNVFYLFPYILSKKRLRFSMFDEIIQQLIVSMIQAIDKFDVTRGSKFTAYIPGYIKEAIDICLQQDTIVYLTSSARKKITDRLREQEELGETVAVSSSYNATATSHVPNAIGCFYQGETYLEEIHQSKSPYNDSEGTGDAHEMMERSEYMKILEFALSEEGGILSEKERVVVTYRFGIFGAPKLTLKQVAELFHTQGWRATVEWIFQLEKRSTSKLNKFMGQCGLTEGLTT
jgi:DNA-directed RNA polymerase specialized sigma subunit